MKVVFISILLSLSILASNTFAQQTETKLAEPEISDEEVTDESIAKENTVSNEQAIREETDSVGIKQQLIQLQQTNQVYQKVIKNLITRIEKLEQSEELSNTQSQPQNTTTQTSPAVRETIEAQMRENTDLINSAFEQRLSKEGGMLLGYGQFTYEPGLSYTNSSYETVVVDGYTVYPVLVIGDIVSEKVKRGITTINQSLRFGLGADTQLDLVIPMGTEKEEFFREDGSNEVRKGEGLGDVSIGISYQLVKSNPDWPDTVIAFNWKTQTGDDPYQQGNTDKLAIGSGFDSYAISLTSMANTDPVVMFGGFTMNYTESDSKPVGRVQPGISYGLNLGMALALNMDTSLSFSFQFLESEKTEIDGSNINGSDVTTGTFSVGLSTGMGDSHAIDIDLGIGLTSDSPDFQLTVSFPLQFTFTDI